MKNRLLVFLLITGIILGLTGCKNVSVQKKEMDESALETAKSVYDIAPLMTTREKDLIYSELKDDKDLHFYFDILGNDRYIKVNHKGADYLLLWYYFYSYTEAIAEVTSVEKIYAADEMKITVDTKNKAIVDEGCFANGSYARLILKLDQDVSRLYVNDKPYAAFDGGKVKICGKAGLVDKNLKFLIPPVYNVIEELDTLEKSDCPTYYRVYDGKKNGVLDNNYKPVLSNSYGNIFYINENRFIAGISGKKPIDDEIVILDGSEKVIKRMKGFLCANDERSHLYCADGHMMISDPSSGENWGNGIVDKDLNIIIKPVYKNIFWEEGRYMVRSMNDEVSYFNEKGEQY